MNLRFFILSLSLLFLQNWSYGHDLILLTGSENYHAVKEVGYMWDGSRNLTIEEIQDPKIQQQFIYEGNKSLNFGITDKSMWFKVQIKNLHPELQQRYILELAYPHFDTLVYYFKNEKSTWNKVLTGDRTPFKTRKITNKHFAFPVTFADTTTHTFYFYLGGEGSHQFPFYIQPEEQFYASQAKIDIVYGGAFFGIIIVMLLYNFFIYLSLKEKVYIYYVLMHFCAFIVYLSYSGYGYEYIWSQYPWINARIIPLAIISHGFTGTIFTRNFLDTKLYTPVLHKVMGAILIIYVLILLIIPFVNYEIALKMTVFMAFSNSAIVLITSLRVWMKGNMYAQFMVLSFSIYLIGILLLSSNIGGIVPKSFFSSHSMEMGTAIELTLLSFALGYKYSSYRKQKEEAQAELLEVQKKINEELEKKVEERTVQINNQKGELLELNKVKDKLLSIISHDLKGPLNAMQSLAKMMRTDKATEENQKMYSMHFSNKIGTMSGLLENILQWIRSQREGLKFKIQTIDLREVIIENINVASSQAELKGIKIMNEIHSEVQIMGDKNVVHLVVRNLLSNAIKFTESGGEVHVSSKVLNGEVEVEVRDTGVGMSAEKLAMLFHDETHFTTPDTTKKDGTGLGLLLCKEFLSKTSGEIWAESKEGEGSSFKFRLPKG